MERVNAILCHETYQRLMAQITEQERDRIFCKHGIAHQLDVARIGMLIAFEQKIHISRPQLYAAALLHDIGRAVSGLDHEQCSVKLAEPILKDVGFSGEEQREILEAIAAHRDSGGGSDLAWLLYRADKLSRNCFACEARQMCYWPEERKNNEVIY
ncbi:HD domain-containing protein [Anaerolentibacter hominis]|uniref:HD domain-containing protein n=1 Tax=Anaerolentibacter hominis TaxID=3079009 RepID=UPI0031B89DB4